MRKNVNILIATLLVLLAGCGTTRQETATTKQETATPPSDMKIEMNSTLTERKPMGSSPQSTSPAVYIYKTKADYSQLVPVLMNDARTRILSYPAPGDLKLGDGLRLPTALVQGYWLDNKGIGPNVAFLTYTYEEYSKLPAAPSMEEMMANIVEKHPLVEIRECGRRADYKDIVSELNEKIAAGVVRE